MIGGGLFDQKAVDHVNELGNRLRKGFNKAFNATGIKGQATGLGSMVGIHWRDEKIISERDTAMGVKSAGELPRLLHLEMINRGIFSAPRGMYSISTPMTEDEIDKATQAFEETLELLKPYMVDMAAHLLSDYA